MQLSWSALGLALVPSSVGVGVATALAADPLVALMALPGLGALLL